eukprot:scaffold158787_cov21-Tisochrysis_lutea.AAC.4
MPVHVCIWQQMTKVSGISFDSCTTSHWHRRRNSSSRRVQEGLLTLWPPCEQTLSKPKPPLQQHPIPQKLRLPPPGRKPRKSLSI